MSVRQSSDLGQAGPFFIEDPEGNIVYTNVDGDLA